MSVIRKSGISFPAFPMFDDFLGRAILNWGNDNYSSASTTMPSVNIKETTDSYEVEVAVPGMEKKDFKVSMEGNLLTISSAREQKNEDTDSNYILREFSCRSFMRTIRLHKDVMDLENIHAGYENGLLHLTIPKKEAVKQKLPRMIEVA